MDALRRRLEARRAAPLDVVGIGECSLDEVWILPGPLPHGGKAHATGHERLGGGQVATALVACSRLGLRTAFAGAVGDDEVGKTVLAGLSDEGVDVTNARLVAGGATRSALVLVDQTDGGRTIVEHTDRRVVVPHGELPVALIERARVLHLDATHVGTSLAAARLARERGVVVSLDLDHLAPGLDDLLALADVCITSESLPAQLTGKSDLDSALRALAIMTGAFVCCTLGPRAAPPPSTTVICSSLPPSPPT